MDIEKLKERYGKSEHGRFAVVDTIGTPHPYCITDKHVVHVSDRFGGRLGEEAIIDAEKHGARCGICKGQLTYKQHERALLIDCYEDMTGADHMLVPELHEYLMRIKAMAEEDKYAGFAFRDSRKK